MLEMIMMKDSGPENNPAIKWAGNPGAPVILTEAGNLYTIGNAGRLAGVGTQVTVYSKWTLIDSDVEVAGNTGSGLLYRKTNGTWFVVGYVGYGFGGAGDFKLKTEVTSYCSAISGEEEIVKITGASNNTYVLLANGNGYGVGRNAWTSLGNRPDPVQSFVELNSLVGGERIIDINDYSGENLYIHCGNKAVYGIGSCSYGRFGSTNAGQFAVGQLLVNNATKLMAGVYAISILRGNVIYTSGSTFRGQLGDGVVGAALADYRTSFYPINLPANPLYAQALLYGLMVKQSDGWYYTGDATYIGKGDLGAVNYSTLTKVTLPGLGENPNLLFPTNIKFNMALDNGKLMITGDTVTAKIPGYSSAMQASWVELPLTGVV